MGGGYEEVSNPYSFENLEENYAVSADIHVILGLEANFVNKTFTRLEGAIGKTAGSDFNSCNAYGGRRRCNLTDDGVVTAYQGDSGFVTDGITKTELNGKPAGTHVQVMVEQPKFYYKVEPVELANGSRSGEKFGNIMRYYICDIPQPGFSVHPAFIVNGVEKNKIYLAAFEGCLYDNSASKYITDDAQIADFNTDKLSSIAGVKPISGFTQELTRANARKLAHNRGSGWEQSYIATASATQLLMVIEYGQFNIQQALGQGVSNKVGGTGNVSENTGATISLGNNSGEAQQGSYTHISYRGEENFYGNIWTWVDGINYNDTDVVYIAGHDFDDNKFDTQYSKTSYIYTSTVLNTMEDNNFIGKFEYTESLPWLFVPGTADGSKESPIGDFYWYYKGDDTRHIRPVQLGGSAGDAEGCGPFNLSLYYAIETSFKRVIGARLVYIPT